MNLCGACVYVLERKKYIDQMLRMMRDVDDRSLPHSKLGTLPCLALPYFIHLSYWFFFCFSVPSGWLLSTILLQMCERERKMKKIYRFFFINLKWNFWHTLFRHFFRLQIDISKERWFYSPYSNANEKICCAVFFLSLFHISLAGHLCDTYLHTLQFNKTEFFYMCGTTENKSQITYKDFVWSLIVRLCDTSLRINRHTKKNDWTLREQR